jgi:hypothetical protein
VTTKRTAEQMEAVHVLLNDQWVIDEIREEIKRFLEVNENENTTLLEPMGHSKGCPNRKAYRHEYIH